MSRDWRLYLTDIREAAAKIVRYTRGMDATAFLADERTRDAVLRNLEIIGEAAKRIPVAKEDCIRRWIGAGSPALETSLRMLISE